MNGGPVDPTRSSRRRQPRATFPLPTASSFVVAASAAERAMNRRPQTARIDATRAEAYGEGESL